jgi:hypothetical protein
MRLKTLDETRRRLNTRIEFTPTTQRESPHGNTKQIRSRIRA